MPIFKDRKRSCNENSWEELPEMREKKSREYDVTEADNGQESS